jgi:hypothetical protein
VKEQSRLGSADKSTLLCGDVMVQCEHGFSSTLCRLQLKCDGTW